jgi:hypothetical protein
MSLVEERVVGDDASTMTEALLLQEQEGAELDEGGQTTACHVRDGVMQVFVEAAESVCAISFILEV